MVKVDSIAKGETAEGCVGEGSRLYFRSLSLSGYNCKEMSKGVGESHTALWLPEMCGWETRCLLCFRVKL